MPNTLLPTQIGYTPVNGPASSQIIMGQDVSVNWEAVGLGANGRPDPLQNLIINISSTQTVGGQVQKVNVAKISINVADILAIASPNGGQPSVAAALAALTFKIREATVCVDTDNDGISDAEMKMMILASDPY